MLRFFKKGFVMPKLTYAQAQSAIQGHLKDMGWELSKPGLKVPYATSPDGKYRLWFKSQAIYASGGKEVRDFGSARSVESDDYRAKDLKVHAGKLVEYAKSWGEFVEKRDALDKG